MYIHIGGEYSISDKFIIGIFSLETVHPYQTDMTTFLRQNENAGKVEYIGSDFPQTVVVAIDRIYVSSLSAKVLLQRTQRMQM